MQKRIFVALLATAGLSLASSAPTVDEPIVDERFFETLENMIPRRSRNPYREGFTVESAIWNNETRVLMVNSRTDREKGMFLSLMGLPASTWVDDFEFSSDHTVEFVLPIAKGSAVPCQVVLRSAFEEKVVPVSDAPAACDVPSIAESNS